MPILSFSDSATQDLFNGINSKKTQKFPPDVVRRARNKLFVLDAAQDLKDLRTPPANRLEALKGDREGFYSIRINNQWRIVFRWVSCSVRDVEIVDYHS
ncbi:MAG: type II toxin-antitoxin system RelE/ParE family toxin [Cyanobacteria bacterium P01_G01_bin.54]